MSGFRASRLMKAYMYDSPHAQDPIFSCLHVHESVQDGVHLDRFDQAVDTMVEHSPDGTRIKLRHMQYMHLLLRQEIGGAIVPLVQVPRYRFMEHNIPPHSPLLEQHPLTKLY